MSNRKLMVLGITAAAMVVLAMAASQIGKRPPSFSGRNVNLVQGLDTSRIGTVVLISKDEKTEITRAQGGRYVVVNKENYPALINEINGLVAEILDIKTLELVTSDSGNHKDLGVSEDNARYIVKFLVDEGKPIEGFGGIVISETDPDTGRVYVRLLASNDVYLIENAPWPRMSSMDYIDKRLTTIDREKIQKVTVSGPRGQYTLELEGDSEEIILASGIPDDKKWKGSTYRQVFGALSGLQFDDVKSFATAGELNFDTTYTARLKDSTVYTFKIAQLEGKTFLMADAAFTGAPDASITDEQMRDQIAASEAAQKYRQRHKGWVYEISSLKAGELTKPLADLLEEKKDESAAAEAADGNLPEMLFPGIQPVDPEE